MLVVDVMRSEHNSGVSVVTSFHRAVAGGRAPGENVVVHRALVASMRVEQAGRGHAQPEFGQQRCRDVARAGTRSPRTTRLLKGRTQRDEVDAGRQLVFENRGEVVHGRAPG